MANLQQCPNGHYYDPSVHSSCPYCSNAGAGIDRTVGFDKGEEVSVQNYDIPTAPPKNPIGAFVDGHDGKTAAPGRPMAYQSVTVPIRPLNPTEAKNGTNSPDAPKWLVVGWLVAIEGPYRGKSFEIHHGNTYIGRETGDIVLTRDAAVSASKHANTIYEERKNRYYLVAGQSTNLVYVDDELLPSSSHVELKPYSSIEIGKSKFLFVPFCTDQFKWPVENG